MELDPFVVYTPFPLLPPLLSSTLNNMEFGRKILYAPLTPSKQEEGEEAVANWDSHFLSFFLSLSPLSTLV